jgi:uncharacterized protein (TIRG00374 family)
MRRVILGVALTVAVYATLAVLSDVKHLVRIFRHFHWWALGAALVVTTSAFALRTLRWFVYMRRLGVWRARPPRAVTFREALGMALSSGKAGQVFKSYYLSEAAGVPYSLSIPAGLAERMSDVVGIVLLLLVGLVVGPRFGLVPALIAAAGLLGVLLLMRWEGTGHLVVRLVRRIPRLSDAAHHVEQAHAHLRPMLHARPLVVPVLLGLGGFALEATGMWILGKYGMGLHLDWGEAAFVLAAADVLGTISLIPGGLGVVDGGIVGFLLLLDIDVASGTALELLTRMCTLWLGGLLDGVSFFLLRGLQPMRRPLTTLSPEP